MTRKAGHESEETKANLLRAATVEFAAHGYQKASLRSICSRADVTTGALYFFFRNKEDLFCQTIAPVTDALSKVLSAHYEEELAAVDLDPFADEPENFSTARLVLDVLYDHHKIVDILVGERGNAIVDKFLQGIVAASEQHARALMVKGGVEDKLAGPLDDYVIHWYAQMQVDMLYHVLDQRLSKEESFEQIKTMIRFMRAGMRALLDE